MNKFADTTLGWLATLLFCLLDPSYNWVHLEEGKSGVVARETMTLLRSLAKSLSERGLYGQAKTVLDMSIKLGLDKAGAYMDRAMLYLDQGRVQAAAEDIAEAEKLAPDQPVVQYLSGKICHELGDYPGALKLYTRAVTRGYNDPHVLLSRAQVYCKTGDMEKAVEDFHAYIAQESQPELCAAAYVMSGSALKNAGLYEKAVSDLVEAIKIWGTKPKGISTYQQVAECYLLMGLYDEAIAQAETAIKHQPNFAEAFRIRAAAREGLGQLDLAKEDYARINKMSSH